MNKKMRQFPGVKGPRPDRAEQRAVDAEERTLAWRAMSPKDQLASLDQCLGKDQGAKKQRARLQRLMERGNKPAEAPKPEEPVQIAPDQGSKKMKAKDRRRSEKRQAANQK